MKLKTSLGKSLGQNLAQPPVAQPGNPYEKVDKARELIDAGVKMLLDLIDSRQTLKGNYDEAEAILSGVACELADKVCALSNNGHSQPVHAVWNIGTSAAETIETAGKKLIDANAKAPEQYKAFFAWQIAAGESWGMPILWRAKLNPTSDAGEIAKCLGLASSFASKISADVRYNLDTPAVKIVLGIVEQVAPVRERVKQMLDYHWTIPAYEWKTNRDLFKEKFPGENPSQLLAYASLPPFRYEHRGEWWEECVKPILEKPEILEQVKIEYPDFYSRLERNKSKGSKDYAVLDELKKRCQQVLNGKSLYRPTPIKPR